MPHFRTLDPPTYDYQGVGQSSLGGDTFEFAKDIPNSGEKTGEENYQTDQKNTGGDSSSDPNEPGLQGVVIYSDLNDHTTFNDPSPGEPDDFVI